MFLKMAWIKKEFANSRSWLGRLLLFLLLIITASLLVSCASVDASSTQYVGVVHSPPSDPATVEILRSEPTRPHERLGEVVVDASTDPAPPVAQIEDKLKKEAAKMGADAVVIVYDQVQPVGVVVSGGYWTRTASTVTGHRLVGLAIKYR